MALINKILFPVDFSPACFSVARYVEAFAGRFEAEILLLHVVGMGDGGLTLAEEQLPHRQAQLNSFLADELKYFTTERVCVIGDEAAPEIVAAAQRWHPDLMMMPTRGLGTFQRLLLGSITAKILDDLDCPVWTNVHSDVVPPLEDIHCRRVLCALDLTDRSQYVLEWAAALAAEYEGDLGIVHATSTMPRAVAAVGLENELTRSVSQQVEMEIASLQKAAGTAARVFVQSGDPPQIVTAAARDFDADLVIIGRHESGRRDAYAILRDSPCPVISI
jgi:nucleotide-binding universal stress UspA family protein